jgi:hypothetical protein
MNFGNNRQTWARLAGILCAVAILAGGPGTVSAQSYDSQPRDLEFSTVNATTGEPVTVARLTIDYVTERRNNVADFEPEDATFVARGVPILEAGKYIITAWHQGVPYWWSKQGRDLAPGTTTLHVFDTTSALDNVVLTGMNLVIRRQESLLRLEYMLQVTNNTSPQATIMGRPGTFELALPRAARDIKAVYTRGPDPTGIPLGSPGRSMTLEVPLTPGANQIRIEAVVPWTESMNLPVGSNLPVEAWSVLAAPEWLEVHSTDMEENDREKVAGFRRFVGFPLEAGEAIDLRLNSGEQAAGEAEDLFTGEAPAEQETTDAENPAEKSGGMTLPLILVGVLIIVVIIAAVRRRS